MSLFPGEKLGPYEILASIGAGGMGEVWKAHDTRLGRDVAINVSAQQFTERFEREPRAMVRQGFNRAFTETGTRRGGSYRCKVEKRENGRCTQRNHPVRS